MLLLKKCMSVYLRNMQNGKIASKAQFTKSEKDEIENLDNSMLIK